MSNVKEIINNLKESDFDALQNVKTKADDLLVFLAGAIEMAEASKYFTPEEVETLKSAYDATRSIKVKLSGIKLKSTDV